MSDLSRNNIKYIHILYYHGGWGVCFVSFYSFIIINYLS